MALKRAALALAVAGLLWAAAAQARHGEDAARPHHVAGGFRNVTGAQVAKPFSWLVRWRVDQWREGLPQAPRQPTPVTLPQLQLLKANTEPVRRIAVQGARPPVPSATWIGHATVLVQSGGLNILTDPVFSERASPVTFFGPKRAQPPGIALADLPPIDVVVVSHNHYDHLDRLSAVQLNERSGGRTLFLVPLGLKDFLARQGIANVVELDWWDAYRHEGVEFRLVPVQHWSARGLHDRYDTLWGGWAVFAPDLRWYFSGDAGYSGHFAETRERLAVQAREGTLFDLALLAIGAYEPRWFMREQHMNPAEAVRAHQELGARRSLGIHWGTFTLTDEALDQPPVDLAAARQAQGLAAGDFFVLPIGGTWWAGTPPAAGAKQ
ncbi:MBL fold metallo-hydrolase [Ramlibacter monticola]|uniref:MBL fold metallo-hydrolase n=1 Tax=Ramlibacter monticola TaxID=1926872 RepID=A0A936Z1I4_9BURK|nr:MBL fold metallo-hydrolase [Ramlibacter monticola]MBL0391945.1 MBL fold metallo-hydrolase [Ramlibacter monticola]